MLHGKRRGYNARVSADDLIRFARRDWDAIEAAKTQHWLRRKQTMSPGDVWRLGYELWRHARIVRPSAPSLDERVADLDVHYRVGRALRAVAHSTR